MTSRENCMCELCENMRQHFDTSSPNWNWPMCPIWERRNKTTHEYPENGLPYLKKQEREERNNPMEE